MLSASRLGLPDTGPISYGEMVDQCRNICQAASLPVIGDADTGYGNALNIQRRIACVMIEDQVAPKRRGHTRDKKAAGRATAFVRIRAAIDALQHGRRCPDPTPTPRKVLKRRFSGCALLPEWARTSLLSRRHSMKIRCVRIARPYVAPRWRTWWNRGTAHCCRLHACIGIQNHHLSRDAGASRNLGHGADTESDAGRPAAARVGRFRALARNRRGSVVRRRKIKYKTD